MKLHYKKLGSGQPMLILHGLFGSSDNWQTLGKKLAENFEIYLVDQRNHGHSPHSNDFDYELLADDLHELISDLNLEDVILVGHSMGGKTIMQFAQHHADLIQKMIVVDMGPKAYPMHHDVILEGLNAIDLNIVKTRKEADRILSEFVPQPGVKQFLLKNLFWKTPGEELDWRINIPVLEREIRNIIGGLEHEIDHTETLFIRGALSNYIIESDYEMIKELYPNSSITTIEGAGHWVHAEKPVEFYQTIMNFAN